jgi:catechol 2,3-dioxygenase
MSQSVIAMVYLNVANLEKMLAFYQDIIGLKVHHQEGKTTYLGAGGEDLLALNETPAARRVRGITGLYHFALLLPSRAALARSLKRLVDTQTPLQGMSDHLVSEAIYLADPEGNGIEIYRDRPREVWYAADGQLNMDTVALDIEGVMTAFYEEDTAWNGLPPETIIGHIHLHVSDIPQAEAFYRDLFGLDVLFNMGHATFMSYEGYHHHIGANIWAGRNLPPDEPVLGLEKYMLRVPDTIAVDSILDRMDAANVDISEGDEGYFLRDSSKIQLILKGNSA